MRPFYVIMGILSFLVGILCMVNPFGGMAVLGILIAVFLLLVGFFFIMMFVMVRENRVLSMDKPAIGVAGLLLGIALIVIAVLSIALPNLGDMLELVILVIIAFWMIINGIVSIFSGMNRRRQDQRGSTLMVVLGVILTVVGIYGLLHMVIFREWMIFVTGVLLLVFGVDLLCGLSTDPNANSNMFGIPETGEDAAATSETEDGAAAGSSIESGTIAADTEDKTDMPDEVTTDDNDG